MRLFTTRLVAFTAALLCVFAGGCSRVSPAVGTWSLGAGNSSASLVLREDGTGTLRQSRLPDQPISWTEKEGAVTLQLGGGAKVPASGAGPATTQPGAGVALTGTLSEDKKSMTVGLGPTTLTLQKQEQ